MNITLGQNTMNKQQFSCQNFLTAECEENLVNLIREMCGIRIFVHQMEKLRQTVCQSCKQFNYTSCELYLEALQDRTLNSSLQEDLIAGITVGESYFFRDHAQMDYLKNDILPKLIYKRREQGSLYLRIWSAGCSDGQELYSVVILLHQLLPDLETWNLHLLGTDINVTALSRALKGYYTEWSFRSTDNKTRDTFFTNKNNQWQINNTLQRFTKFSYLNLYSDNFPSILSETNTMDLILCRNVFIYFDQLTASTVMKKFNQSLLPGGYLLQSASDILDINIPNFDIHYIDRTCYFQKTETPEGKTLLETTIGQTDLTSKESAVADMQAAVEKGKTNQLQHPVITAQEKYQQSIPIDQLSPKADILKAYSNIIKLLSSEKWSEVLDCINKRIELGDNNALIWQFKAKTSANLGQAEKAIKACNVSIKLDPFDKHSHFIQALVYMEAKQFKQSEEAFRRTIYLDRQFIEAYYHLGLLHFLQGKHNRGRKHLQNALEIVEKKDPFHRLHDAAGMTHGRMAIILRNELRMYQLGSNSNVQNT